MANRSQEIRLNVTLFHLYDVPEQEKLNYDDWYQSNTYVKGARNAWNEVLGRNFVECWKHSVSFLGWCLHKCICLSKLIKMYIKSAFYGM